MKEGLKKLWARWKVVAHKIGEFQSRLILSLFYYVVLAPFALGLKVFSDPLQLKRFHGWIARSDVDERPAESAWRQF
jgi:hypothetical protein